MAFIRTIPPSEAQGPVREMYEQARSRFGYVPNWAQAFSLRPGVRDGCAVLLKSIQSNLPVRSYELATLAAARALRSSYCALAHGSVLADKVFDAATVTAIVKGAHDSALEPRERAMIAFVEKVVLHGKLLDALGVQADSTFNDLDPTLRQALTVGRPVET
jgi:alkylhydroperoxidase family enzyme